jgi:DNA helicase HerA-like ATPase
MADRLYTSNEADEVLSALRFETRLEKATLARMAFAISLTYEADNKKDDSLIEVLRDLSDFDLFWRHGSDVAPIDKISNRTLLIDVHAMPVLKELVAYLVIERLYKEMALLPDSPVRDGRRTIRSILVIDEAHNYLSQKNIFQFSGTAGVCFHLSM